MEFCRKNEQGTSTYPVERMSVEACVLSNGWNCECNIRPSDKFTIVHVEFINNKKTEDAVSFDIEKFNIKELTELFSEFCKKNKFANDTVTSVSIVAAARTMDKIQEIDL